MSNVNKCLDALKDSDVEFVNIHAENIIEGDEKITLGLIWTILHHFQVFKNFDYLNFAFPYLEKHTIKIQKCRETPWFCEESLYCYTWLN